MTKASLFIFLKMTSDHFYLLGKAYYVPLILQDENYISV